jgi:NAD(P)-dependent dehydrogenase (short-subunit alcohol dehydrogenase family)
VVEAVSAAQKAFGGIDILLNNAAITSVEFMMRDGMIHELDVGLWDQTMAVNVRGYMLCAKHVVPAMLERGGGVIVNTASGAFKESTGGTLQLTLNEVFADDTHAVSLVRLTADRPDRPDKHMDEKEANVFHLDDKGRAYEFWGVADDQASLNSFWTD